MSQSMSVTSLSFLYGRLDAGFNNVTLVDRREKQKQMQSLLVVYFDFRTILVCRRAAFGAV